MKLSNELLAALRCPESRQPLKLATEPQLAGINAALAKDGEPPLESALVCECEDPLIAYPIEDDYPILLIDRKISIETRPSCP